MEFFAPVEDMDVVNGTLIVTPGEPCWQAAEKLTENQWIVMARQSLEQGKYTQEEFDSIVKSEAAMTLNYKDRFYAGRNYALFAKLSGVRGDNGGNPMSDGGNGLPDDLSPEVAEDLSLDDPDLHSHTHFTLTRLLEEDWKSHDRAHVGNFTDTVLAMQALAIEKAGGNTDHVRAIMAYDN